MKTLDVALDPFSLFSLKLFNLGHACALMANDQLELSGGQYSELVLRLELA